MTLKERLDLMQSIDRYNEQSIEDWRKNEEGEPEEEQEEE